MLPKHARYQAALLPDWVVLLGQAVGFVNRFSNPAIGVIPGCWAARGHTGK